MKRMKATDIVERKANTPPQAVSDKKSLRDQVVAPFSSSTSISVILAISLPNPTSKQIKASPAHVGQGQMLTGRSRQRRLSGANIDD
jgi:hypothetical protein